MSDFSGDDAALLSSTDCWALLGAAPQGRVNAVRHALPDALPVSCRVVAGQLELSLQLPVAGQAQLLDAAVVSFEADLAATTPGQSVRVVVIGTAEADQAAALLRVHPTEVSGHRLPLVA